MFQSVLDRFDKYYEKMEQENHPTFNFDLANEARKRIQQLDYHYELIETKHLRYMDLIRQQHKQIEFLRDYFHPYNPSITMEGEDVQELNDLGFEIETFTESFYYLAACEA